MIQFDEHIFSHGLKPPTRKPNSPGFAALQSLEQLADEADQAMNGEKPEKAPKWLAFGTPRKTNECPLKIDGWFRCISY